LEFCAQQSVWYCPICHNALPYYDLVKDLYFLKILEKAGDDEDTRVEVHPDGSFEICPSGPVPDSPDPNAPNHSEIQSAETQNITQSQSQSQSQSRAASRGKSNSVIIEILSDDDDDQAPPPPTLMRPGPNQILFQRPSAPNGSTPIPSTVSTTTHSPTPARSNVSGSGITPVPAAPRTVIPRRGTSDVIVISDGEDSDGYQYPSAFDDVEEEEEEESADGNPASSDEDSCHSDSDELSF
jgi:hypothetical protein